MSEVFELSGLDQGEDDVGVGVDVELGERDGRLADEVVPEGEVVIENLEKKKQNFELEQPWAQACRPRLIIRPNPTRASFCLEHESVRVSLIGIILYNHLTIGRKRDMKCRT